MTGPLVGIDVGTSGVKGLAIDADGGVLAGAERGYPLSTPRPGWAEQDPEDWWHATSAVLGELGDAVGAPAGIGLSGQMHGLVALDARGRVLRPAILWNDQRTGAESEEIERTIGLERLIALTGNRALPGYTAPKLLWLRRHEPEVYRQIDRVALPKDYVRLRLCGEHATDVSDASGTLLLDVARRRWSEEVLTELELDPAWLPVALESPATSGVTGDGVPVAAGGGDQAAGALGVGVDHPGPLSVVLGTSGVVFSALDGFAPDPEARLSTFCHAVPGGWHSMGVVQSAAGSLRWLRDAAAPGVPYEQLIAEAARVAGRNRGAALPPVYRGRAHAARRPGRAGRVRRAQRPPRSRGARPGGARGSRVRSARLARTDRRAVRADHARSGLRRRRAQRPVAADRRLGARAAARAGGRRRGRGVRSGAARGRVGVGVARRSRSGRGDGHHRTGGSTPSPSGSTSTECSGSGSARSTQR